MKGSGAASPARKGGARNSSGPNRTARFTLSGPSRQLDPRVHAVRSDVADVALAALVFAPHYAKPLDHGCIVPRATVRVAPTHDSVAASELLLGECFAVVDAIGAWAWGYGRHDGYVGYVDIAALGAIATPTHRVSAPAALIFASANIKSRVVGRLPMGALVAGEDDGAFLPVANGFVHLRHVHPLAVAEPDPVTVAERLIGTPYRWGGRSGDGIDCSGLVQLAFAACGVAVPRDSDQQRDALPLAPEGEPARRGDLVFLPGHVALMADADTVIHANAHWMATVREPLADMLERQPEGGATPIRRRPTW